MNYQIIEKGYEIDLSRIEEGFLYDNITCTASSRNEARAILNKKIKWDGLKLKYSYVDINYLNIPVKRSERIDKVLFEDKPVMRWEIDSIIRKRNRMELFANILRNPLIKYCYIIKNGNYYRPNSCGYTSYKMFAGIFEKEDAVRNARSCEDLVLETIDDVVEHNKMIQSQIDDLKTRLILC